MWKSFWKNHHESWHCPVWNILYILAKDLGAILPLKKSHSTHALYPPPGLSLWEFPESIPCGWQMDCGQSNIHPKKKQRWNQRILWRDKFPCHMIISSWKKKSLDVLYLIFKEFSNCKSFAENLPATQQLHSNSQFFWGECVVVAKKPIGTLIKKESSFMTVPHIHLAKVISAISAKPQKSPKCWDSKSSKDFCWRGMKTTWHFPPSLHHIPPAVWEIWKFSMPHFSDRGHYIPNPNNALLWRNPSNWPCVCIIWSPHSG